MSDKIKAIRLASEKEFERLLDHMAVEAHHAADHWHLLRGLEDAAKKYGLEMNESRAFWSFTLNAHYDVTLFRLARLYDQHESSLSLKRFLLTVEANAEYFHKPARRARLKGNSFVDGLLTRRLKLSTLREDIRRVSEEHDPLVKLLCKVRNESLSHVQPNPIRLADASARPRLKPKEIQTLLNRARRLLNRYSLIYRASSLSAKVVGADDYKHVLELIRRGRDSVIAADEEEIQRIVPKTKP